MHCHKWGLIPLIPVLVVRNFPRKTRCHETMRKASYLTEHMPNFENDMLQQPGLIWLPSSLPDFSFSSNWERKVDQSWFSVESGIYHDLFLSFLSLVEAPKCLLLHFIIVQLKVLMRSWKQIILIHFSS